MKRVKACGVLLFRRHPEEEFLLMQHADRLDLPKGHAEPGESERECALRELREETGIPPERVMLDPEFRFTTEYSVLNARGEPRLKTLVIFLGRLTEDWKSAIIPTEHLGYSWHPWRPPHRIQANTLDPLLAAVEEFRRRGGDGVGDTPNG